MEWQALKQSLTEDSARLGKQPTALLIGRFQPFHKGHAKVAKLALDKMGDVVVAIVQGQQTAMDKKRNPFPIELRKQIVVACMKGVWSKFDESRIRVLPDGFIASAINTFRPEYEIRELWCGADRGKLYQSMLPYAREMGAQIKVMAVSRNDEIESTAIRKAMISGDKDTVRKYLCPEAMQYLDQLMALAKKGVE